MAMAALTTAFYGRFDNAFHGRALNLANRPRAGSQLEQLRLQCQITPNCKLRPTDPEVNLCQSFSNPQAVSEIEAQRAVGPGGGRLGVAPHVRQGQAPRDAAASVRREHQQGSLRGTHQDALLSDQPQRRDRAPAPIVPQHHLYRRAQGTRFDS